MPPALLLNKSSKNRREKPYVRADEAPQLTQMRHAVGRTRGSSFRTIEVEMRVPKGGKLGLTVADPREDAAKGACAAVASLDPKGLAAKTCKFLPGDLIISVNDVLVRSHTEAKEAFADAICMGGMLRVALLRGGFALGEWSANVDPVSGRTWYQNEAEAKWSYSHPSAEVLCAPLVPPDRTVAAPAATCKVVVRQDDVTLYQSNYQAFQASL